MSKKRNKKKAPPTPTKSFDQMVAATQIAKMKPLVQQEIMNVLQPAMAAIQKFVLGERASMQTRQLAFERLLKANVPWFTNEILAMEIATVEDESQGLVPSTEPVKVGDKVRVDVQTKADGEDNYGEADKFAIHEVGTKSEDGFFQTDESLEKAIIGMRVGETKEFEIIEQESEKNTPCKVTVICVSCSPEEEPAEETKQEAQA